MKILRFALLGFIAVILTAAVFANADFTDRWQSRGESVIGYDNQAPYHVPADLSHHKPLDSEHEIVYGTPSPGAIHMRLDDGKFWWVLVPEGCELVFSKDTNQVLRREDCSNAVDDYLPLPRRKGDTGAPGADGKEGQQGLPGTATATSSSSSSSSSGDGDGSGVVLVPVIGFGWSWGWGGGSYYGSDHECDVRVDNTNINNITVTQPVGRPPYGTTQTGRPPTGTTWGTDGRPPGGGGTTGGTDGLRRPEYQLAAGSLDRPVRTMPKVDRRPVRTMPKVDRRPVWTMPKVDRRPVWTMPKVDRRPVRTMPKVDRRPVWTMPSKPSGRGKGR